MSRRLLPLLLLLAVCRVVAGGQVPEAKEPASPSTPKQTAIIREGVGLHERGDFDGAIRKYEEALAENPSNALALYEMAFAYQAKGDYRKSLEVATRGARYKSEQLGELYTIIGTSLDRLGEPQKAVEVFKKGIKLDPANGMLHFNLAVTYHGLKKPEEARKSLKAALTRNPGHPTSHLMLSLLFFQGGYRVPALLAASRFLTLEPQTPRSAAALRVLLEVLGGGVRQGANPNEMTIFMDMGGKKDEGDFTSIDVILGLSAAAARTEKNKDKTQAEMLVEQMKTVLNVLSESPERKNENSFVHQYYVPYFAELKQRGHVEAFTYYALMSSGLPGVSEWVNSHSGRVQQFLIWSKQYRWPDELKS